jgi:hypothetical protein
VSLEALGRRRARVAAGEGNSEGSGEGSGDGFFGNGVSGGEASTLMLGRLEVAGLGDAGRGARISGTSGSGGSIELEGEGGGGVNRLDDSDGEEEIGLIRTSLNEPSPMDCSGTIGTNVLPSKTIQCCVITSKIKAAEAETISEISGIGAEYTVIETTGLAKQLRRSGAALRHADCAVSSGGSDAKKDDVVEADRIRRA